MLVPIGVEVIISKLANGAVAGATIYKLVKLVARKDNLDELKPLYKDIIFGEKEN